MKKSLVAILWLAVLLVVSGNSLASSAWWMMCDWCQTDSDFQHQALNAPGTYSPVYVTNRQTNETRKYNRMFIVDDLWDGIEQTVAVTAADFPDAVNAVFEQAVNDANIIYQPIPRNDLVGIVGNVGAQSSVIGDLSSGSIDPRLVAALRVQVELLNLLPTATSVSEQAGINIEGSTGGRGLGAGFTSGEGETIRIRDLTIEIKYSDGSAIVVSRRGSDGKLVNWGVSDAEGNLIPIDDPPEGLINPDAFVGREFFFGGSGSQAAVHLPYSSRWA